MADVAVHAPRPFLSGRDYHSMHHQNGAFRFDAERRHACVTFRQYDGVPATVVESNGDYRHAPDWHRQFLYTAERDRGLDDTEDLASPGEFTWRLSGAGDQALWVFRADVGRPLEVRTSDALVTFVNETRIAERRRRAAFPTGLARTADAYVVRRGSGRTISSSWTATTYQSDASTELNSGGSPWSGKRFGSIPSETAPALRTRLSANRPALLTRGWAIASSHRESESPSRSRRSG